MKQMADELWLELLRRTVAEPAVYFDGRLLPAMPDAQLQINTVGQAGQGAIDEAWEFAWQCLQRFGSSECFYTEQKTLLDFGTGWARIARCFLRDFAAENIIGVDVDGALIEFCRGHFPGPTFLKCDPMPPLAVQSESVDFVVGYSVFSHLSEEACRAWLAEFARLLKPGGMVALTTRGRWFFDYAEGLAADGHYKGALSRMFPDFAFAKACYDNGQFVHSNVAGVSGGGLRDESYYGETFIPEKFAREVLGAGVLRLTEFFAGSGHPILFYEKPE